MTERGSSRPLSRLAIRAGRGLLLALLLVAAVPLWVLFTVGVALLHLIRPFVIIPLGLIAVGGAGVAIYFGLTGDWGSVASAVICSIVSSILLLGFTTLGEWLDPDFGRPTQLPPWWWSV